MTPDGDIVVVWTGNGVGDQQRHLLPPLQPADRHRRPHADQLPAARRHARSPTPARSPSRSRPSWSPSTRTCTTTRTHTGSAVTNPANYQLLQNGVAVAGGISQVYYGLDRPTCWADSTGFEHAARLNKYEAVLIVDANGAGPGVLPLTDGQYQIVALNTLRDKAGNPLISTGAGPNGGTMSGVINVTLPTGQETRQCRPRRHDSPADATLRQQYTYATTADVRRRRRQRRLRRGLDRHHARPQGVWAKMYQQTIDAQRRRHADDDRRRTMSGHRTRPRPRLWANNEIPFPPDPTASDISVARDADGDFVVTWSAWNADAPVGTCMPSGSTPPASRSGKASSGSIPRQRLANVQSYSTTSTLLVRGDGRRGRLRHHLAEPQPGRQRLRHLCPGLQCRRQGRRRHQRGPGHRLHRRLHRHFQLRWDDDNNPATPDTVSAPITFNGNSSAAAGGHPERLRRPCGAKVNVVADASTRS